MSFGYPELYANGVNNNTQLRRATDMIYQRGATYDVVLTGDTYQPSMVLQVQMYKDSEYYLSNIFGSLLGNMSVVPYQITQSGATYTYRFGIRPYEYLSNYIQTEHYQYYWLNDWYHTDETINKNNPYPNILRANFKYGWLYMNGNVPEYENYGILLNDLVHYTDIPFCTTSTGFTAADFSNTGAIFDYVGGVWQMNDKFYLPNFDQELGTVVGTGITINTIDVNRRLSPMSQFLMDYPNVPEYSETSRFLTESPRILTIQEQENYVLYYLAGITGDYQQIEADFAVFEFYDENNNQIDYFEQILTNFPKTNLGVYAVPCGPKDIENIYASIDWDSVAYYRVQLFYSWPSEPNKTTLGPIGPVSEAFYFYVDYNCGPENTRLAFLNSRGGYDYFTFTSYRQDTKKITRQTFDNRYYATSLASPDRNMGRTLKTFDSDVDQEIVLESDYLSIGYGKWLQELFLSPQVYIMKEDYISPLDRQDKVYKDLTPVQVLSTEVETITKKHRKLNKYRITLKTADTFFTNKGF